MNNYLVSFPVNEKHNLETVTSLRKKLEKHSPNHWIEILPNQMAIKSTLSTQELAEFLQPESNDIRTTIVSFDEWHVYQAIEPEMKARDY